MHNHYILYKNHSGKIGSWEIWTEGPIVHSRTHRVLGGKPTVSQYTASAKKVGQKDATSAEEQAAAEAASKYRLKLDKGYVTTLEEAELPPTNALGLLRPMLATPIEKIKVEKIDWQQACVQPKLDGHRALYKDGVLYSRQGKVLENLDHIITAIKDSGLGDFHLDGEIYIHGYSLQELSKLIKKFRPGTLSLEYHIYDHISDQPFFNRIAELAMATKKQPWDNVLQPVETKAVGSMEDVLNHHQRYRDNEYEGTMLRFSLDSYTPDKRSRTLLKLKEFHDAEFNVIDWEEGKPYVRAGFTYHVPVWVCEISPGGPTFTVTAAGNMQEKHDQFVNADSYRGKPLTVKYHYLSKDGIPQLPVALRWREDF
jgi:DNA ligase-1